MFCSVNNLHIVATVVRMLEVHLCSLRSLPTTIYGLGGTGVDVTVVACTDRNNTVDEVFLIVVFCLAKSLLPSHLFALAKASALLLSSSHSLKYRRDGTGRGGAK